MYNQNSIVQSMLDHDFELYWRNTSSFESINTFPIMKLLRHLILHFRLDRGMKSLNQFQDVMNFLMLQLRVILIK